MSCLTSSALFFAGRGSWILHHQANGQKHCVALITQSVEEIATLLHLPIPASSWRTCLRRARRAQAHSYRQGGIEGKGPRGGEKTDSRESKRFPRETTNDYKELIINTEASRGSPSWRMEFFRIRRRTPRRGPNGRSHFQGKTLKPD